jgi:hypothetical protein
MLVWRWKLQVTPDAELPGCIKFGQQLKLRRKLGWKCLEALTAVSVAARHYGESVGKSRSPVEVGCLVSKSGGQVRGVIKLRGVRFHAQRGMQHSKKLQLLD